jgi:biopolymer transport protein ExbD
LHTLQAKANSPLGTVITQASQATTQQVDYSQIEFKNKMEKFIESTNLKIDNLASEVNELKMAKSNSTLINNDESVATNEIADLLMKEN